MGVVRQSTRHWAVESGDERRSAAVLEAQKPCVAQKGRRAGSKANGCKIVNIGRTSSSG